MVLVLQFYVTHIRHVWSVCGMNGYSSHLSRLQFCVSILSMSFHSLLLPSLYFATSWFSIVNYMRCSFLYYADLHRLSLSGYNLCSIFMVSLTWTFLSMYFPFLYQQLIFHTVCLSTELYTLLHSIPQCF